MTNVSNDFIWECTKSTNSYLVKRKGIETTLSRDPYALNNLPTHFESGLSHDKAVGVHYCKPSGKICVITKVVKNANKPAKSRHIVEFKPTKSSRAIAKAVSKTVQGYKDEQIYDAIVRASAIKRAATVSKKQFAARNLVKAVVAGAAGGIGQPLSLLLKLSPYVTELALYDVVNSPGVAADLSHISTKAKVTGYLPKDDGLKKALTGANIVVIPAGIPRKPGMTRDDLFKINAGIVRDLVTGVAQYAPDAFVLIISNPVNSTVPIAAEVLKKHNVFNPKKLFGVTTLDVVRAQTFTAAVVGESDPTKLNIPVVGGHSGDTIVPLLSLTKPKVEIPADKLDDLVKRIQFGGDEVVQAKDGLGSATLSMAQAGFRFAEAVLKGAAGEKGIIEPAYIYLEGIDGASDIKREVGTAFFSVPVEFGPEGAAKAYNILPEANDYEKKLLKVSIDGLYGNIAKGEEFIVNPPPAK